MKEEKKQENVNLEVEQSNKNSINFNKGNDNKSKKVLIVIIGIIILLLISLTMYVVIDKNNNIIRNEEYEKINYEIKEVDSYKSLYVNGKLIKEAFGEFEVKEFKDLLIVDEQNPYQPRKIFTVDKNGNVVQIEKYFINGYRIDKNNLYIKIINKSEVDFEDWYCYYPNKNEVIEYEIKYEYVNGKFDIDNEQILNEVTISNKYKNEMGKCQNIVSSYTKEQTKQFVYNFPYARILESKNSYEGLWRTYKIWTVWDALKNTTVCELDLFNTNINKVYDKNQKKYGDYKEESNEYIAKGFGLTVDEIANINDTLWNNVIPEYYQFKICEENNFLDGNEFIKTHNTLFGEDDKLLNSSVIVKREKLGILNFGSNSSILLYDANVNKFIIRYFGGIGGVVRKVEIINEKEENNEYKIEFVEGYFYYGDGLELNDKSKVPFSITEETKEEEYRKKIVENKDKLPNYEVTFEKTNDGYSYKSIKKI